MHILKKLHIDETAQIAGHTFKRESEKTISVCVHPSSTTSMSVSQSIKFWHKLKRSHNESPGGL